MTNPSIGVLIVEDDPVASSVYEQLIQNRKDFTVIGKAQTASETIQLLNVITPDLILLDVHLPDANGIDLLFQIKHAHRHVDIIMITASNDAKTVRDAMRGGAYSYLLKPIMVDSFFQHLKSTAKRGMPGKQMPISNKMKYSGSFKKTLQLPRQSTRPRICQKASTNTHSAKLHKQ
ncbi:response regulator [Cytobacillus pseudoceanisediminis]|uniref:response regulator n=1 Tax=Cytobacillus pseudoceanisediminis TaxID=3051614 RepID=UPI0021868D26|nr:response regulator [Cytobacillus pseudoceanisediminis]UQX52842.1 response regulator [Cytobacillus pseudoceanisediminis]